MKKTILILLLGLGGVLYAQQDTAKFKINLRAGINNSFFMLTKQNPDMDVQIQNDFSPRIGIEGEYVFPFNKFRWSTIAELYYQNYNYANSVQYERINTRSNFDEVKINYQSLNLLLGLKYTYAELGRFKSYLALKGNYALPFDDSAINFETLEDFDIIPGLGFLASLGFVYNKRITFEFEYSTRSLVDKEIAKTRLNTFTFLMAYRIL